MEPAPVSINTHVPSTIIPNVLKENILKNIRQSVTKVIGQHFTERPYLWAKFIWQFADAQSSIRQEGDTDGINDKGTITYDRKVKKMSSTFIKRTGIRNRCSTFVAVDSPNVLIQTR